MKYQKLSRRMILQGSGAALAIPFLESLVPREARAQSAEPVKRYFSYGLNFDLGHARNWLPKLTTLANPIDIPGSPQKGSYERLSSIMSGRAQLSPIFNSSMNPFIDQMMMYKGLDIVSHGFHSNGTNYHLGSMWAIGDGSLDLATPGKNPHTESLNCLLARHVKFDPAKRSAVHLQQGAVFERDALGKIIPKFAPGSNALSVYNALFNNGTYPEAGSVRVSHPRRDLLTRVMGDYGRIINGRQIGTSDKIVLTSALDSISDLQRGLEIQVTNSCRHKGFEANNGVDQNDLRLDDNLSWSNYIKLIVALFQCDITRVITMASTPHNFEDWTPFATKDYHGNITHQEHYVHNGKENWLWVGDMYGKHFRSFVAPLMTALESCIDPINNKSFLYNGLAHLSAESNYPHRQVNIPTVTIGSLNGRLPTGYIVNYTDPSRQFTFNTGTVNGAGWSDDPRDATDPLTDNHSYDYPGIPYQRFLVTVLQAMGLSPADYEDPNLNKHVMNRTDSVYGAHNNNITNMGGFGICSLENAVPDANDGAWIHHALRMTRYNWNFYKFPVPLPPKV